MTLKQYKIPRNRVPVNIPIKWTIERQKDLIRIYLWG